MDFRYVNRRALEEMIVYSPCADFHKIYAFSNLKQRSLLTLIISTSRFAFKKSNRKLYNNIKIVTEAANMEKLFAGHSDFDFGMITQTKDNDELVLNLKESIFMSR